MRLRRTAFLASLAALFTSCAAKAPLKSDSQRVPDFLFERRPFTFDCVDRSPEQSVRNEGNAGFIVSTRNQAPYLLTRSEELSLSSSEAPALTITADSSNMISVTGSDRRDWFMRYCARAEGNTGAEAREGLRQVSLAHLGSLVQINRAGPDDGHTMSSFLVEAPAKAQTIIHASFSSVEVRDMNSPVRVTASHARARILDTTGQVDVNAFVIDFAGSRGKVALSAEAEINLKLTASRFEGTILAWAQRPVRVLVPEGFITPFQAMVNRPQDFICRADFCSKVKQERKNGLYVLTYTGDGGAAPENVHLRSEQATVVIDNVARKK